MAAEKTTSRAPDSNRDAILRFVKAQKSIDSLPASPWSFSALPKKIAVSFDTGLSARNKIAEISDLTVIDGGPPGYFSSDSMWVDRASR